MVRRSDPAPLLLLAFLALAAPLSAQSSGPVWAVSELRAHPGQEQDYSRVIREFEEPIFDELVRTGYVSSYQSLVKQAGNMQDGTHILIIEYPSWDNYIDINEELDRVTRRLFDRSRAELAATEYFPKRDVIRRDVYLELPDPM